MVVILSAFLWAAGSSTHSISGQLLSRHVIAATMTVKPCTVSQEQLSYRARPGCIAFLRHICACQNAPAAMLTPFLGGACNK